MRGFSAGNGLGLRIHSGDESGRFFFPVGWQVANDAAFEFGGQFGEFTAIVFETVIPIGFVFGTGFLRAPTLVNVLWNDESGVMPTECLADQRNFVSTQRGTMAFFLALFVRRTEADNSLAQISVGLSVTLRASSMASFTASALWPSTFGMTCQP